MGVGGPVPRLKVKKSDRAQRKMGRMSREMEISLAIHDVIDQCITNYISLVGIYILEFLTALGSEPERAKNIGYF